MTEPSTALDSEGEKDIWYGVITLNYSDDLESKLLDNCPPINISTTVYIAQKK